jgi:hypothetical protein
MYFLAANKGICSRHWLISLCLVFLTALFFLSHNGASPSNLRQSVTDTIYGAGKSSCSVALASHVKMLKSEYSKLLPDVTHVAMIGYPDHR